MSRWEELSPEVLELFAVACEGTATDEQIARLESLLLERPELRKLYADYFRVEVELRLHCQSERAMADTMSRLGLHRVTNQPTRTPTNRMTAGRSAFRWAAGLLAIVVLVAGALYFFPSSDRPAVAELTDMQGAEWSEGQANTLNGQLVAGQRLELTRGLVEVTFACGATMIVEGPATVIFDTEAKATLAIGKVTANVPTQAVGFTVVTPSAQIVDLGTEFGVTVTADEITETEVFEGLVEVRSEANGTNASIRLKAGESARASAAGVFKIVSSHGFVRSMSASEPLPETNGNKRSVDIINASFERDSIPDGRKASEHYAESHPEWRTPFGWRWTETTPPEYGGLANPSTAKFNYPGTDGDQSNGAMDGSQVFYMTKGVGCGAGLEQELDERFTEQTTYRLCVAAGVRKMPQQMRDYGRSVLNGEIKLLAGTHELASLVLPEDEPLLFREYSLVYEYQTTHRPLIGQPLRVQLLRGPSDEGIVDYDNVRLFVEIQ